MFKEIIWLGLLIDTFFAVGFSVLLGVLFDRFGARLFPNRNRPRAQAQLRLRNKKLIVILMLVIVATLVPFNTTLVKEWRIRVVDEARNPYKGKLVRQFCGSYTLGIFPCDQAGDSIQLTDENGYVVFPERKIRASLISRGGRSIFNLFNLVVHGSYGVDIYVDSSGPQGYKTLKYVSGEQPPTELVLPSESREEK